MKKEFIIFIILPTLIFTAGFVASFYLTKTPTIYINERLESCESKGGRYHLYFNKYDENYKESCEIISKEVKGF